jgi:hypothetical protein
VSEPAPRDLDRQLQHLEGLIREMEDGPESPARARAREIVRAVLDLHAAGLARMLDAVAADAEAGRRLLDAFARDPLVAGVLLLHGLHPLDLDTRVHGALAALEPELRTQGARVSLVSLVEGAVRLRVEREIGRAGLPAAALRSLVEQALVAAAPDAVSVVVDMPEDAPRVAFVPVEHVRLRSGPREIHQA